jgi:hypothetical protein
MGSFGNVKAVLKEGFHCSSIYKLPDVSRFNIEPKRLVSMASKLLIGLFKRQKLPVVLQPYIVNSLPGFEHYYLYL